MERENNNRKKIYLHSIITIIIYKAISINFYNKQYKINAI